MSLLENDEIVRKKILLLGDPSVGKTSLIRRFVQDKFDDKYITTIGTKVSKKKVTITKDDIDIHLSMLIWDTMGQRGFQKVLGRTISGASGFLLVCDLTRKETLDGIGEYWIPTLSKYTEELPMVLLGNKKDLGNQHQFSENELAHFSRVYDISYFLTSAKTGEDVEHAFIKIGELMLEPMFASIKSSHPGTAKDTKRAASEEASISLSIAPTPSGISTLEVRGKSIEGIEPVGSVEIEPEAEAGAEAEADTDETTPESYTLISATKALMDDIYKQYGASQFSMAMVKHQFSRVGFDQKNPQFEQIKGIIDHLTEIDRRLFSEAVVRKNRLRRMGILNKIRL